ncbi:MAG: DUF1566 domain-containing protein [Leptospira sp.]|nr:DUF1566 domain-containing protein [Leptospira sp.]
MLDFGKSRINFVLVLLSMFLHNCLTGYYLSQEEWSSPTSGNEEIVLLTLIASRPVGNTIAQQSSNDSEGESNPTSNEPGTTPRTATPEFNLQPGIFSAPTSITLNSETPDATIHYTLNESEPEPGSPDTFIYENPLPIYNIAGLTPRAKSSKSGYEESEETTGLYSLRTLRTGQTNSFQPGDDGDLQPGGDFNYTGPTQHPTFTNDYTTTDNYTGLVWKTCREGRSGADCLGGEHSSFSWDNAVSRCESLNGDNGGNGYAGRSDWRLPEFRELESLYRYNIAGNPSITTTAFPNTNHEPSFVFRYWSKTLTKNQFGDDLAMFMDFRGNPNPIGSGSEFTSPGLVRCVAGQSKTLETPNLIDNGNRTIHDRTSGLTWTKCGYSQTGQNCDGTGAINWAQAFEHCNQLTNVNFAGKQWRLPTIRELVTLLNPERTSSPFTYISMFPNTRQMYWSFTTRASDSNQAWVVNFGNSGIQSINKVPPGAVVFARCVAVD